MSIKVFFEVAQYLNESQSQLGWFGLTGCMPKSALKVAFSLNWNRIFTKICEELSGGSNCSINILNNLSLLKGRLKSHKRGYR